MAKSTKTQILMSGTLQFKTDCGNITHQTAITKDATICQHIESTALSC